MRRFVLLLTGAALALVVVRAARADSVAQVATAKRISRQTVTLIDPQGRPNPSPSPGTDTAIRVGDVLTFIIQFTPVPNGAYRGLGGYITDYIPPNAEVVGARLIDRNGNTVKPHRGGLSCDGFGPRGSNWKVAPLLDGSMSQLYADTGIFFSTDTRTQRRSHNPISNMDEPFLSLKNGVQMPVAGSGIGMFADLLGATAPFFAHNDWDLAQQVVYGPDSGNTPEHVGNPGLGYGSPVSGPQSWYQLENTVSPSPAPILKANSQFLGNVGPWRRIRTTGGEIGRRGQGDYPRTAGFTMPQCANSMPTRVGIPAMNGPDLLGWNLNPSPSPLPSPTNAVRFALGELVVGDEYFAEISLKVKALPLDPTFGDINCAEVAGGDASARAQNGGTGGKDHLWRYFLPAPSCVSLNLFFENTVDKVLTVANQRLNYNIEVKNLSTSAQNNVQVRDCYDTGNQTLVPAGTTPGYTLDTTGAGCPNPAGEDAIVWTVGTLMPGEARTFTVQFTAKSTTSNHAVYTSQTLAAPGFVATAFTTVAALAVMRLDVTANPNSIVTPPGTVHYTAKAKNVGTGAGSNPEIWIDLPANFSYTAGTAKVNGVAVANPTVVGQQLQFSLAAAIGPGATATIEFDAAVAGATPPGVYTVNLTSWVSSAQLFEDSVSGVAPVAVGQPRSDTPSVTSPIVQSATSVSGSTTEAAGTTIRVFVNGNPAGSVVTTGAGWTVTVPPLFAGQRVTATAQAPSEFESFASPPVTVLGINGEAACKDGRDNDGDGKCDSGGCMVMGVQLPLDPGCLDANDLDETDVPQCSDGKDNNGANGTDFPNDPGCSSYEDDSESGAAACGDGVDNDGDGKADFPADPGCSSASDVDETDVPACADGVDNDGDGLIDFPADPDCTSSLDDESALPATDDGGVADLSMSGSDDALAPHHRPDGMPPDPGGVNAQSTGGCNCDVNGRSPAPSWAWAILLLGLWRARRRGAAHR